ncbi:undecaprenyldiphospho-muramoylpentapeptide beta-N-acetylglucosaminyltransferase [Salinicoccus roseus]|uniref:undecaprenyldiphospho-muramoylpentapeptide beta-N-acetylglucosaminyltransferase n=1 Tax=Salinicoccus roseus TaxID=45670 RepID=UPI0023006D25|nr:undecaprenyldiphospho-muramoylpentapeptide beta-N-acetylglucosaminyltransferase [Salinicoccus roseus]
MEAKKRKVVLTGGGTVGHVMLNKLLIPCFINKGVEPVYIGSKKGIEKEIIGATSIKYYNISSGKLRRYISAENFKDVFKVMRGVGDARKVLKKEQVEFVFSKGGFVSVPVVLAAKSLGIPVYIHESDITPGLANRIAGKFATKIYVTFKKTLEYVPKGKSEYLGPVIRDELKRGYRDIGYELTGFTEEKPVMIVMGGSLGARSINTFVRENLDALTKEWQIIHLCGRGNYQEGLDNPNYRQFEFVKKELPHLLRISDIAVGRSGSNAIYEFLLNEKPMILIPLPLSQSRGDQVENAEYFKEKGYAEVIQDEELDLETFQTTLDRIEGKKDAIVDCMKKFEGGFRPESLVNLLLDGEAQR